MGTSKVSVDLNQRTFEIEVPDENIQPVLKMLGELFSQLPPFGAVALPEQASSEEISDNSPESNGQRSDEPGKTKRKRSGGKGGTKARPPELVDLGLSADQRRELVSFFTQKSPKGQNDQVAVLGVKLKEFKNKSEFNMDEIHSAFKVIHKPTPKNLLAVFGNMKRDGKGGYADGCLVVNSFTEDHVTYHMANDAKGD